MIDSYTGSVISWIIKPQEKKNYIKKLEGRKRNEKEKENRIQAAANFSIDVKKGEQILEKLKQRKAVEREREKTKEKFF